jgi:FkbM family methyltransferase
MNIFKSLKKRLFPAHLPLDNYDQQLTAVMRRILRPDSNCIDVGCHVGNVLREMMAIAPRGDHHAFEALPHLAATLADKFPAAQIHAQAVSDASGCSDFQHVENDPAYSGLRRRIYDRPDPQLTTITVQTTTLDEAIPYLKVALIKLDIEGGEYHAIRGATNLIRRGRPYIAFEASHKSTGQYGVSSDEMFDLLAGLDYDLSTMKRWLAKEQPIPKALFAENWMNGPDFFWFAIPR